MNRHHPVIRRLVVFTRHFQKQQISKLFQVIAIAYTMITKGITESPDFGDYGGGGCCVVAHCCLNYDLNDFVIDYDFFPGFITLLNSRLREPKLIRRPTSML